MTTLSANGIIIAAVLSFIPTLTLAQTSSQFPWKDLDRTKDINAAFGNKTHSFNVADNWKICMSHILNIPYRANVSDYAPIISKALDILKALGGGSVKLSRGTFPVASSILMPSHTCMLGAGPTETMLKLVDFAPSFYPVKGVIRSSMSERVSLQGIAIDGNKMSQSANPMDLHGRNGAYFELVNYAWFRNVIAKNHSASGFDIHGANNRWSYHLIVEGSVAEENGEDGFKIHETFYGSIFNCLSYKNARHGISIIAGSMHTLVKRNKVASNGAGLKGCGISMTSEAQLSTRSALLADNHIHDSDMAGICLQDVSQILVDKTNITNTKNWRSFCYDVHNTATFSISNDTVCTVRSGVTYNPRNLSMIPAIPGLQPGGGNNTDSFMQSMSPQAFTNGCGGGIGDRDVCCPLICGACGGDGCGNKLPNGHCCYSQIQKGGGNCVFSEPPCVMGK